MIANSVNAWNRFWFEKRSTQSLCLLRVFFGAVFLMKITGLQNLQHVGNLRARFPKHAFDDTSEYYLGAFRLPVPGFEWLPVPELWQYQLLEYVLLIAGVLFVVGLFTRWAGSIIAVIWLYQFLLSQFTYRHHVMMILVTMLVLGFSRCDEHYSFSAYMRGSTSPRPPRMILPIRLLYVFISIIYLFSFLGKLNPSWISGDIMLIFRHQGSIAGDLRDLLDWTFAVPALALWEDPFYRSLAWFTMFAEAFLAFGFWVPRLRSFAILLGLLFHLGIDLTMSVNTFSFQMFALYIVFISPESGRHLAFYDGASQPALYAMRLCRLLDWLKRITWVDARNAAAHDASLPLDGSEAGIIVLGADGRWRRGYSALLWLCSCFPLTFIPSWIMRVPSVRQLGAWLLETLPRTREGKRARLNC